MTMLILFYKSLCQEKKNKNKAISNYKIRLKHRPLFHKLEKILSANKNIEYSQINQINSAECSTLWKGATQQQHI